MFTALSTSFCCSQVKDEPATYQRELINNIATALDIISGLAALFGAWYLGSGALAAVGGLQIAPFLLYATMTVLAYREKLGDQDMYVKLRPDSASCPCCPKYSYAGSDNAAAAEAAAINTDNVDQKS